MLEAALRVRFEAMATAAGWTRTELRYIHSTGDERTMSVVVVDGMVFAITTTGACQNIARRAVVPRLCEQVRVQVVYSFLGDSQRGQGRQEPFGRTRHHRRGGQWAGWRQGAGGGGRCGTGDDRRRRGVWSRGRTARFRHPGRHQDGLGARWHGRGLARLSGARSRGFHGGRSRRRGPGVNGRRLGHGPDGSERTRFRFPRRQHA
ncbi:hypothetical protein DFJ74DRAFT_458904 [Hyaloraphidium curvatum]|nr:hypothetical protein DFJ74DRAFT_458904 [Hyaloraphidium curvatum]